MIAQDSKDPAPPKGDKDAYQLVSDHTRVVTTRKGITDVVIYGPDEVLERYGVTAAQFPDFLRFFEDENNSAFPGIRMG